MNDKELILKDICSDQDNLCYIRKILRYLFLQVYICSVVALAYSLVPSLNELVQERYWLSIVFKFTLFPIGISLYKVDAISSNFKLSLVFAGLFTFSLGSMFGALFALLPIYLTLTFMFFFMLIHVSAIAYSYAETERFQMVKGINYMLAASVINMALFFVIFPAEKY